MTTVTKAVKASGGDYTTIAAWEADLDDTGIYSSGDDAVGELYDEVYNDDYVIIDGGGTVGLNSVALQPASGQVGDGTEGTGPRIVMTADYTSDIVTIGITNTTITGLEVDGGGYLPSGGGLISAFYSTGTTASSLPWPLFINCMAHDMGDPAETGLNFSTIGFYAGGRTRFWNCLAYELYKGSGGSSHTAGFKNTALGGANIYVWNCTAHKLVTNAGTNNAWAFYIKDASNKKLQNCIGMGADDKDFYEAFSSGVQDHNMSSDTTASGTGSITSETTGEFVSVGASPDYHLASSANAIGAGTPITEVTDDIDGDTRDASTPDMGYDEFVAAAGAPFPASLFRRAGNTLLRL